MYFITEVLECNKTGRIETWRRWLKSGGRNYLQPNVNESAGYFSSVYCLKYKDLFRV